MRLAALVCLAALNAAAFAADDLAAAFDAPPLAARTRCYWWWLNGNIDKAAITKDLEWMKSIGMGGGLVFDAGGGGRAAGPTPTGPLFGSPEWRTLLVHAVREAERLGLELTLSPQSGWNLGGPQVKAEQAGKVMAWSELPLTGPQDFAGPLPAHQDKAFHDIQVLACRVRAKPGRPIRDLRNKALFSEQGGSAPDCRPLLLDVPAEAGEADCPPDEVVDLTASRGADGVLRWQVPAGEWVVLRFGWIPNGGHVSTSSGGWKGMVVDYLDAEAVSGYWKQVADPILDAVGPQVGKALAGIETDSWEGGGLNWSRTLPGAFRTARGYDLAPWLPVVAGRIIGDRDRSNRFLADLRKTIAELMADQHYTALARLAADRGLYTHCEAGGPHAGPFDALANLGRQSMPMGEFWVPSPHRPSEDKRFFMKTPSSAAHLYGRRIACGEGFTSVGPQWNDVLWRAQKPTFDHEACAGLNLTFIHAFTCSPASAGLPGQEYFAGTHFNPQVTWASMAGGFVAYLNRCQALLQRGLPVADALVYVGDHVPNIPGRKQAAPAGILPGHDFDWCNEEALLTRIQARDGMLALPDGVTYRALVLPNHGVLSLPAARKVRELVLAGVPVAGVRPTRTASLSGFPASEADLKAITDELWGGGRIAADATAALAGIAPDVSWTGADLDWVHRRDGEADLYFVASRSAEPAAAEVSFRIAGRQPELWDPMTGTRRNAAAFVQEDGRTRLPLTFAPYGSVFVVFRQSIAADTRGTADHNTVRTAPVAEVPGPWEVAFDPAWGAPAAVRFETLIDWTAHTDPGIRAYSGLATYRTAFDRPAGAGPFTLDLGRVCDQARVVVNGRDLGVAWAPPFRIELPVDLQPTGNTLEIRVANTWWNRLQADLALPPNQRLTRTNITIKPGEKPLPSGLLGPVQIQAPAP